MEMTIQAMKEIKKQEKKQKNKNEWEREQRKGIVLKKNKTKSIVESKKEGKRGRESECSIKI